MEKFTRNDVSFSLFNENDITEKINEYGFPTPEKAYGIIHDYDETDVDNYFEGEHEVELYVLPVEMAIEVFDCVVSNINDSFMDGELDNMDGMISIIMTPIEDDSDDPMYLLMAMNANEEVSGDDLPISTALNELEYEESELEEVTNEIVGNYSLENLKKVNKDLYNIVNNLI